LRLNYSTLNDLIEPVEVTKNISTVIDISNYLEHFISLLSSLSNSNEISGHLILFVAWDCIAQKGL